MDGLHVGCKWVRKARGDSQESQLELLTNWQGHVLMWEGLGRNRFEEENQVFGFG